MQVLKVASRSNPNSVAGALAGVLEQESIAELHAIGAGAVNQTVKAIAISRRLLGQDELRSLKVIPGFMEITIGGEARTGIRFIVEM